MSVQVAINGFGRIGRLAFRLMYDSHDYEIVAINDLSNAEELAYLLKYDSAQGRYREDEIRAEGEYIHIGKDKIRVYAEKDPNNLPWKALGVDVVLECTGVFNSVEKASAHINAGAKAVILSAPGKGEGLKTVVYNVNHEILDGTETVVSGASCTTNCLAPIAKVLNDNFGIKQGFMTTIHAYTNDQNTLDGPHKKGYKSRRGRAAAANIVPASTGAAKAVGLVIPELQGRLDGIAMRVPTITGSSVDLTFVPEKHVTVEEINAAVKKAANETLKYTEDPIVSSDVIGDTHGSIFDALSTKVMDTAEGQLVKVVTWYDNEMSYTAQMIRTAKYLIELMKKHHKF